MNILHLLISPIIFTHTPGQEEIPTTVHVNVCIWVTHVWYCVLYTCTDYEQVRIGLLTKNFIKNVPCTGNPEAHKSRLISLDHRIFVKKSMKCYNLQHQEMRNKKPYFMDNIPYCQLFFIKLKVITNRRGPRDFYL